uniref:Uncharacterized protein n=1 Tax=Ditylenchus dipsaci TaxID=166011 RepID=A0A915E7J6_9BILA
MCPAQSPVNALPQRFMSESPQFPANVSPKYPMSAPTLRQQPTISPGYHAFSLLRNCCWLFLVPSTMNKRVFVDGKAHEVFFVGEEAVIERNGLPHRIVFSGPARDVIIDNVPYRLAFGESRPVYIDGETHVLRFGTPSRELYMGNFPFKGTFGGPPIVASINGRRHEIRLCGPVPEIKVMPEPSYEMTRFLPEIRIGQQKLEALPRSTAIQIPQPRPETPPKKDDPLDVQSFLNKLQKSGVLDKVSQAVAAKGQQKVPCNPKYTPIPSTVGKDDAPVPSNHGYFLQNLQRMAAPMSSLDQFSLRSLVIRYDSVVNALHKARIECARCGIAFKDLYGRAYQVHQDWHVKDAIESKERQYSRTRPWFMTDDWFSYSETELVNQTSIVDEKTIGRTAEKCNTDMFSGELEVKKCCVCHETFGEYWDDDDDAWKIKDCVVERGKPFHQSCWSSIDPCSFFESSLVGVGSGCPSFKDEMDTYEDKI